MQIRIASRRSPLAQAQAEQVVAALQSAFPAVEALVALVETEGDRRLGEPLREIGGKGVFTQELERMLRKDEVDLAVHSLKDLPTRLPRGLSIASVMRRENPRDALVTRDGKGLWSLPAGSRVGTSSPRRRAQLLLARPDLRVEDVRGNVGTRLRKLEAGEVEALVMAAAGLIRLGYAGRIAEILDPSVVLPAPAQGIIALEVRSGRRDVLRAVRPLTDRTSLRAARAERALLSGLGSGCNIPVGALAEEIRGGALRLTAGVFAPDGSFGIRTAAEGRRPGQLGDAVAAELLRMGAGRLLSRAV